MARKLPTVRVSAADRSPTTPGAHARVPQEPVVLGRYRLRRRLGTGGFATVWLARDERLERDVAVKILPRERVMGGRFEREARAAARLSHPAIVTLYEAAVDDEGAYLVSELVRGATLAQLLQAGRLSDRSIVSIGIDLCDALVHAHDQGVVHRDVKPSNVLVADSADVAERPIAKLTDFGVARVVGGNSLTRTGDVIGTAGYMAPEQAEGREADGAADLYSLALVLYEGLTGVNPIRTSGAAQRARRLGAYLPPLRRQRRDLPRELGRAIDQALRPRPRERGGVDDLRAALLACIDELRAAPGVVTSPWPSAAKRLCPAPGEQMASVLGERAADGPPVSLSWPARALAGATAAGLAAWLASAPIASTPIAPAPAALAAGVVVAVLPRIGWLAMAIAAATRLAADGASGAALVVLIAALIPLPLLFRHPTRWPLAAVAPTLAIAGLAGAWPGIAGRAPSAWQRAGLAATGWIWLMLAAPLAGIAPYLSTPTSPPRSVWLSSPYDAVNHLLLPLVRSGQLLPALIWGAGAVLLPSITVDRPPIARLMLAVAWSAALVSATAIALDALHSTANVEPGTAVLGSVAAGVAALAPMPRIWPRRTAQTPDIEAGLA
jgi:serine/threonine protein kinase